jgi:hypothetical protein
MPEQTPSPSLHHIIYEEPFNGRKLPERSYTYLKVWKHWFVKGEVQKREQYFLTVV